MEEKITALVLRSVAVSDNRNLLTVLTPDRGKRTVSVHGSKKLTGKNMPAVQSFCFSDMVCSEKNGRLTLRESTLIESFFELRCDLERCALGYYILELADECAREEENEAELLSLTLNSLYALAKTDHPTSIIKAAHELRLLSVEGSAPMYDGCACCGEELGEEYSFCPAEGGAVCGKCRKSGALSGNYYPLDSASKKALEYIMTCPPKKIFSYRLPQKSMVYLSKIATESIIYTFERVFESLKFYQSVGSDDQ